MAKLAPRLLSDRGSSASSMLLRSCFRGRFLTFGLAFVPALRVLLPGVVKPATALH